MAIKIRLIRVGVKNKPFYRIVVIDSHKKSQGTALITLGFWHPAKKILEVKRSLVTDWIKKGAQMSATVKKLLEDHK